MNERDLKKKLHSTLISKAKINDICKDLQDKYSEQANQYNQALSLLDELLEVNTKLRSVIESEREAYNKLKESYNELKKSCTPYDPEYKKRLKDAIERTKRTILEYGRDISMED